MTCSLGVMGVLGCFGIRIVCWVTIQFIVRIKKWAMAYGVRQVQGIDLAVFRRMGADECVW